MMSGMSRAETWQPAPLSRPWGWGRCWRERGSSWSPPSPRAPTPGPRWWLWWGEKAGDKASRLTRIGDRRELSTSQSDVSNIFWWRSPYLGNRSRTGAGLWRNISAGRAERVQTCAFYPGLKPLYPDTGREDEDSITSAQFLMQAVNSSIIWVQSLKCIIFLKVSKTGFALIWEKMFRFSIFYGRSWHIILLNILLLLMLLLFLQDAVRSWGDEVKF